MHIAIILAFCMALITATSNIVLKKGFARVHPYTAVYFSVAISTFFLWVATILFVPRAFFSNYRGILIFIAIGGFAPTIVRTLTYYGIHKLGAGRAAPLRAMTPFFATIIAIFFLKESPRPGIFLGMLLIVLGATQLAKKDKQDFFRWRPLHFLYPLGAALLAGCAANLRKYGLNLMAQPIFAATIAATSSLIILTLHIIFKFNKKEIIEICHKKEIQLIVAASFLTAIGEIVDLYSLFYGKVSLVLPIFATTPLIIVLLSRFFLNEHEIVTARLVLGTILIICGVYISIVNVL